MSAPRSCRTLALRSGSRQGAAGVRTEGASILAALAIHAGLLLVARAMPPLASMLDRHTRRLEVIEIMEMPPSQPAPASIEARELPIAPSEPRADLPAPPPDERVARVEPPPTGPRSPTQVEPPDNTPPPTGTQKPTQWDQPPDERGTVLGVPGLGGPAAWSMPGVLQGPMEGVRAAAAPTVAPAPRPVDRDIAGKVIAAAMEEKDKKIGLDLPMAGTMSSAVRTAVASSELAAGLSGTIECRVAANGRVTGCRVLGSNGGSADAWNRAAQAAGGIAGAVLPGRYAGGAVVTINVSISESPPAGGKGGIQGAGASFDLSNIGAHATRKVSARHTVVAAR